MSAVVNTGAFMGARAGYRADEGDVGAAKELSEMASEKQTRAARRNVRAAQRAAREHRTLANLPRRTRRKSELIDAIHRAS